MYCPNCAAQIEETQKYCRSCGTDVSLVSQALKGILPEKDDVEAYRGHRRRRSEDKKPPSIEGAVGNFFMGIGFIVVSLAAREYAPAGEIWWFWLLIPAFRCMGAGVGQFLKLRERRLQQERLQMNSMPGQPPITSPTSRVTDTSDALSPLSVTEHTTKHLDPSRPD